MRSCWQKVYFFYRFLIHRYSARQFDTCYVRSNTQFLLRENSHPRWTASAKGKLKELSSPWAYGVWKVGNFLLGGALQARVEKVIHYTFLTLTLELNNPFDKKILQTFLHRKVAFLCRMLTRIHRLNGKRWNPLPLEIHVDLFKRQSLLQLDVIERMHKACRQQKKIPLLIEIQESLDRDIYPILVTQGISGSYWMRGKEKQVVGLFKPFDEEIHAPHNPVGPRFRGALGLRKTRYGCRVGEAAHHEVGAFMVDAFFGFGLVPRTYYATFSHRAFFSVRENPLEKHIQKTKYGSFQEFIEGFQTIGGIPWEAAEKISLAEYQLLVALDVILGNADRNTGNILVSGDKLVAIDHGLCFPDWIEKMSNWYWSYLPQGKQPLHPNLVALFKDFPLLALWRKLQKHCFLPYLVLERMRERIALFAQGLEEGLTPADMVFLFTPEYLAPLVGYDQLLPEKVQEQIALYIKAYPPQKSPLNPDK